MIEYIDILLLENGVFCKAPLCKVCEGDIVCVTDVISGVDKAYKVLAVATDTVSGDTTRLIEKYIGYELPKITRRFKAYDVDWEDEQDAVLQ